MIARLWIGRTRAADAYGAFLHRTAHPDYGGVEGNKGWILLKRLRLSVLLAFLPLVGFAAGDEVKGDGFQLYSWQCGPDWCYVVLPSAMPRRSEESVLALPDPLRGDALLAAIAELPRGTGLYWIVPFMDTRLAYPPKETVASVRRASAERGLRLYGPEGPLDEAPDTPEAARKVGWGKRVYYLDHRWVALPDFEIRYLRTASQGDRPPYAVFEEFEIRRGERRQTIKTDPNFGAWTATRFDFAGKSYVLEVDYSEVLRTGSNHGDLYAWTAEEYRRRQRRLYGGS